MVSVIHTSGADAGAKVCQHIQDVPILVGRGRSGNERATKSIPSRRTFTTHSGNSRRTGLDILANTV